MTVESIRILLVADRHDWVLGTFAREICQQLPPEYASDIWDTPGIAMRPFAFSRALRRADVIHWLSWGDYLRYRGLARAKSRHIVSIFHITPDWPWSASHFVGAHIITMSETSRNALLRRGQPVNEIVRIGVSTEQFWPRDRVEARRHFDIGSRRFLICMAGKSSSDEENRKGLDIFERICIGASQRCGAGVMLFGEGWDELTTRLSSAGAEVFNLGSLAQDDVPWAYSAANCYLCSSRVEGGPMPVLEAMACGLPIVSTPVGHVPEFVVDGINGFIFDSDDSSTAVERICRLVNLGVNCESMGAAGRALLADRVSWRSVGHAYSNMLDQSRPLGSRGLAAGGATAPLNLLASAGKARLRRLSTLYRGPRRGPG